MTRNQAIFPENGHLIFSPLSPCLCRYEKDIMIWYDTNYCTYVTPPFLRLQLIPRKP